MSDKLREALEQIKANCFRSDITDHTALAGIAIIAKEALASTTVATAVTQGDARGIAELTDAEARKIAGDRPNMHFAACQCDECAYYESRVDGVELGYAAALAKAPEIIAALPQAGEVEPAAKRIDAKLREIFPDWESDQRECIAIELAQAAAPPSVIPAAAVGELHERIMKEMWASESEEGDLHSSFRLGTFQRLAHAAIRALPTPSEGLTERYREIAEGLCETLDAVAYQAGNLEVSPVGQIIQQTARAKCDAARAALATPEKDA